MSACQPKSLQEAWDNHFSAFGGKDTRRMHGFGLLPPPPRKRPKAPKKKKAENFFEKCKVEHLKLLLKAVGERVSGTKVFP